VLEAFSEILCSPAGFELAFTTVPKSMQSVFQAVFNVGNIVVAVLSIAISPTYKDPNMVWVYASLAIVMGIVAGLWYGINESFRVRKKVDADEKIYDGYAKEEFATTRNELILLIKSQRVLAAD
jgi:dipeptide/tripeptide permease